MKENKSNKGLVVLVIILFILVLGLGTYIVYDKVINKDEVVSKTDSNDKKETKKGIIKDESKEIVYSDNEYQYKKIPIINIDTEDADDLNKEINEYVDKMGQDTNYGEGYNLSYVYYENDEILSILLTINTYGSSKYYKTVNINSKTGKKVSNYDLIKTKSIDENEIGNAIFDIYVKDAEKNGLLDTYKTQHVYGDEFTSVYDASSNLIKSKKYDDFDMYLNSNGELCVISDVYLIAGPEKNSYIFNLNLYNYEK